MKWSLLSVIGFLVFSGCQNFRYYDPKKPHHGKNQFLNNYDNQPKASFWKWQWERLWTNAPEEPVFAPEIVKTDTAFLRANKAHNTLTWVGHATSLVQVEGVNILMDPMFSERASPVSFAGPKRLAPLPFALAELPPIDVVMVSHGHYDHMDLPTLRELQKRGEGKTMFLVPLGDAELMRSEGLTNVQELDWWEEVKIQNISLVFTPAQHWTQRKLFSRNQSLWGGWLVKAPSLKLLYTGDTGYSKDFRDIHDKWGDIDVALIPIGAYEPRWFMKQQHVNPAEAIQIHQDLHAKLSIGVHWGTFRLADETMLAPLEDLHKALEQRRLGPESFRVLKHGETLRL
ncbi:MBL fold metallo-hydrolase [Bdellovibrio sp. 22V]|uniref:MBL fold metallo-hydrolase n=1 Tax=Bdellovibrio sp. 22V TaxID=3044166 RepID=UPI0025432DD8|nr:MBL fold metallo-hydrolase [Bdellovibrio sp. 22V]WII73859.1 MBL fold metallo-hydrolase [Bdellovibrio sp. 22V]